MTRARWPWLLLAAALGALAVHQCSARADFERRAESAERFVADQRRQIRVLDDEIDGLRGRVVRRDTVLADAFSEIARADSALGRVADTHVPSISSRDRAIALLTAQVADLRSALAASEEARALERASTDSLSSALAARGGALVSLPFVEIGKPSPGVFAGMCLGGRACAGVGVTIDFKIGG